MLFYNPVSGHAAFKNKLDWVVEAFQRRGIVVMFYRTRKEGNEAFIPFVQEVNPDGLLVAGGDGTVHDCQPHDEGKPRPAARHHRQRHLE